MTTRRAHTRSGDKLLGTGTGHHHHAEKIDTDRDAVLAFDAIGEITGDDYKETLVPAIGSYLKSSEKAHLLLRFGPDFEGYTPHAAVDDALLGLKQLHDFERIAVVTDHTWIAQGLRLFGPLMSASIRVFPLSETDAAFTWVAL